MFPGRKRFTCKYCKLLNIEFIFLISEPERNLIKQRDKQIEKNNTIFKVAVFYKHSTIEIFENRNPYCYEIMSIITINKTDLYDIKIC